MWSLKVKEADLQKNDDMLPMGIWYLTTLCSYSMHQYVQHHSNVYFTISINKDSRSAHQQFAFDGDRIGWRNIQTLTICRWSLIKVGLPWPQVAVHQHIWYLSHAARNFVFAPHSNWTLIWHLLICGTGVNNFRYRFGWRNAQTLTICRWSQIKVGLPWPQNITFQFIWYFSHKFEKTF